MQTSPAPVEFEYDAFISYRHNPRDGSIAERLHKALESYRTPRYLVRRGVPSRLKKVFRDQEELPTSGDLGGSIERALAASRFLIVVCSPEALQSVWVLREVEYFISLHGADRVLPLLADGEPDTAFPPGLIRRVYDAGGEVREVIEPLAADVRPRENRSALKLLRTEKLRLLAALLGCKYDELRQREQERRVRRIVTASSAACAFLLCFGAFTLWQLNEVGKAREIAVKNERSALETQSELYAAMARRAVDGGDRLLGLSLAVEALPRDLRNPDKPLIGDAKEALVYAASRIGAQGHTAFRAGNGYTDTEDAVWCFVAQGDAGGEFVTVGKRALRSYRLQTGRLARQWAAGQGEAIVAAGPRADRVVTAGRKSEREISVRLIDPASGAVLREWTYDIGNSIVSDYAVTGAGPGSYVKAGFSPDGQWLWIANNESHETYDDPLSDAETTGHAGLFTAATGETVHDFGQGLGKFKSAYFAGRDKFVINFADSPAMICGVPSGNLIARVNNDNKDNYKEGYKARALGVTPDGRHIAYRGLNELLHVYTVDNGADESENIISPHISADGTMAAYVAYDAQTWQYHFYVYDTLKKTTLLDLPGIADLGLPFIFSADGKYIVFGDFRVLEIASGELTRLPRPDWAARISYFALDDGGRYYIFTDVNGVSGAVLFRDPALAETRLAAEPAFSAVAGNGVLLGDNREDGTYSVSLWDSSAGRAAVLATGAGEVRDVRDLGGGAHAYCVMDETEYARYFSLIRVGTQATYKTVRAPFSTDFVLDGAMKRMITNGNGGSKLWNLEDGRLVRVLNEAVTVGEPAAGMHTVGFFPGSAVCWSASSKIENEYDGITIQNAETGDVISRIPMKSPGMLEEISVVINADGSRMLTYSLEGTQLWAVDRSYQPSLICALEGSFLCSDDAGFALGLNNTVLLADWETGAVRFTLTLEDTAESLRAVFGRDGTVLTMNADGEGDRNVDLWDRATGRKLAALYSDRAAGAKILAFGLTSGGKAASVVSACGTRAYCRALPLPGSFEETYAHALALLGGREFDIAMDMAGLN